MQQELGSAIEILEKNSYVESLKNDLAIQKTSDTDNLLARCEEFVNTNEDVKPVVRVIHHLACSGGSLIAKCISALPNVYLLSEVHPHSYRHLSESKSIFFPSDIATLAHLARFPRAENLAVEIFRNSISQTYAHVESYGGTLILRDHSHSDYCVGEETSEKSTVVNVLNDKFDIKSLVTIRNPIDSFASLKSNYWLHFSPATFDEYCLRVLKFLKPYKHNQIIKYESFVNSPINCMMQMCTILDLPFDDSFEDIFDYFIVTGDSGRKNSRIEPRKRRELDSSLIEEIENSKNFKLLCAQYNFNPKI